MTPLEAIRPPTNETEERLLDAALSLFAERGYEGTSVRDIIEAAGVTRPVLYYYCVNKEDLFKRLVRWKHDEAYQTLERLVSENTGVVDRLRAVVTGSFAFCSRDPRVPRLMFQTAYGPPIPAIRDFLDEIASRRFGLIQQVIQEGLEGGDLGGGDAASLTLIFCCLMDQHLNVLARLPRPQERLTPELASGLVDFFLHGCATGKRRQISLPPFAGMPS